MFLFCCFSCQKCIYLVNLEPIPYAVELKKVPKREMLTAITEMITKGVIPKPNQIYWEKLETAWFHLLQAGKASIKIDPSERHSSKALQDIVLYKIIKVLLFNRHKIYLVIKYSTKEFYTTRFLIS